MIVTLQDFKNEAKIPGLKPIIGNNSDVNSAIQSEIQGFIEKYEPKYLLQFFGNSSSVDSFVEYVNLPEDERKDEEKNTLIAIFKVTIAYFVAFYYFREKTVFNTGIGAVVPQGENGEKTNNVQRSVFIWNQMVKMTKRAFRDYFEIPICREDDIFIFINEFGI